jgi:hypothetical protein
MNKLLCLSILAGFSTIAVAQEATGPGIKDEPPTAIMEVQDEKRHTSQNMDAPKIIPQNQEEGPRTQDLPPKLKSWSKNQN